MNKFLIRTLSGAVYVLIVVGAIYATELLRNFCSGVVAEQLGVLLFGAVFLTVGIIGTHEVNTNLAKKGVANARGLAYIIAILTYLILFVYDEGFYFFGITSGLCEAVLPAIWLCAFLAQLWRHDEAPFATVGYTLLPALWVMVPLGMMSDLHSTSAGILMMVFILIWVNDSFAYMTGMLLGRHKMWERHSPKKTWEGTVGGALFCIATAVIVGPIVGGHELLNRLDWAVIGLLCSVIGTLGDLVESMFKRSCGVKDSGNIMPGHGGVLDRFDSILMAVPFVCAYLFLRIW